MTMTQPYYNEDCDSFARSNYRGPTTAHYDHAIPYGYHFYEPQHQDAHPEYVGRQPNQSVNQGQGPSNQSTSVNTRRRISVACARCRRRKIKCSGDPGDGSGCSACRSAGTEHACAFVRVGSHDLPVAQIDILPVDRGISSGAPTSATYGSGTVPAPSDNSMFQELHRPTLPILQTRLAYPEYQAYNTSPVDYYSYASSAIPRQQFISNNYGAENFRPWSRGATSAPVTSTSIYYEPGAAFAFGSLPAAGPLPSTPAARLPSVTGESFSPLNLASLHTSLPSQTVQERRLPVPYPQSYRQSSLSPMDVPQIRPLGPFAQPQDHTSLHDIQDRSGLPWLSNASESGSLPQGDSMATLLEASTLQAQQSYPHGILTASAKPSGSGPNSNSGSSSTLMGEPILGYPFNLPSSSSGVSLVSELIRPGGLSHGFRSSTAAETRRSRSQVRCNTEGAGYEPPAQSAADCPRRPSPFADAMTGMYNYSPVGDSPEQAAVAGRRAQRSGNEQGALASTPAQSSSLIVPPSPSPQQHGHTQPVRRVPSQHGASGTELRRQSSYEQRRANTAHRMSISNLNGRY